LGPLASTDFFSQCLLFRFAFFLLQATLLEPTATFLPIPSLRLPKVLRGIIPPVPYASCSTTEPFSPRCKPDTFSLLFLDLGGSPLESGGLMLSLVTNEGTPSVFPPRPFFLAIRLLIFTAARFCAMILPGGLCRRVVVAWLGLPLIPPLVLGLTSPGSTRGVSLFGGRTLKQEARVSHSGHPAWVRRGYSPGIFSSGCPLPVSDGKCIGMQEHSSTPC